MFKDRSESFFLKAKKLLIILIEKVKVQSSVVTKTLKIALLNMFKDERSKLKSFLLQVKMNICFNKQQFKSNADKMLYIMTYLKNHTAKWF